MNIDTIYNIRNAVSCLGFLVGIGAGIFLIVRKRTLAGILFIAGFVLFSLEPLADIMVFRILFNQDLSESTYQVLDYIYPCISAPAFFLGSIAVIIAVFSMVKANQKPSNDHPENLPLEK